MSPYPLTFHPIFKERIWGGRRLEELYHKPLPSRVPIGESWEICDRPDAVSAVANGPLAGENLRWLVQHWGSDLLGSASLQAGRFPLLIKILDARERLSLQVHPPPRVAPQLGGEPKTEMWYIAEAAPGAELYAGLKRGCTRLEFAQKLEAGTVAHCFHRLPVRPGDAMFLPSGRVHAIGEGLVIFEIQQNSDTTFRVFDWNRKGLDGKPRALHVAESLASIDFSDFEPSLLSGNLSSAGPIRVKSLVNDPLFAVEKIEMIAGASYPVTVGEMQILGVVSGSLRVQSGEQRVILSSGRFCLLPAALDQVRLEAQQPVILLRVRANQSPCA